MNGVWVVVEQTRGEIERVSLELLGEARRLKEKIGGEVAAVLLGSGVEPLVAPLARHGAEVVYLVDDARLDAYQPELFEETLARLCAARDPALVLFGATTTGHDLAVRMGVARGWPIAAGCADFRVREGQIEMVRPLAARNARAVVMGACSGPRLATVAPDVIGLEPPDLAHSARVVRAPVAVAKQPRIEVRASQDANPAEIDLCEADVVIAAGRGIGSQENTRFVQELATLLGGSVGATRVVVDLGWLPSAAQVGQTGKTVKPRVYVACGISGATQHTMGMKESGSIVAINTDPAAPIFKIADLALQADVQQLLPVLTERCRRELEAT